jgi:hypothetical protein
MAKTTENTKQFTVSQSLCTRKAHSTSVRDMGRSYWMFLRGTCTNYLSLPKGPCGVNPYGSKTKSVPLAWLNSY